MANKFTYNTTTQLSRSDLKLQTINGPITVSMVHLALLNYRKKEARRILCATVDLGDIIYSTSIEEKATTWLGTDTDFKVGISRDLDKAAAGLLVILDNKISWANRKCRKNPSEISNALYETLLHTNVSVARLHREVDKLINAHEVKEA